MSVRTVCLPSGSSPGRRSRTVRSVLVAAGAFLVLSAPSPVMAQDEPAVEVPSEEPGCYLERGTREEAAERASPLDSASVVLEGQMAKICYGSPRAAERVIMGDLVPFGEPWRAGANEATGLHLEFPAEVAGVQVPRGSYSLYALPGEREWVVFLSADFERWGIPIGESVRGAEVAELRLPVEATEEPVENLTYRFESAGEASAHLILEWERTRVRIPIRNVGS